jgi:hypothetical protein
VQAPGRQPSGVHVPRVVALRVGAEEKTPALPPLSGSPPPPGPAAAPPGAQRLQVHA